MKKFQIKSIILILLVGFLYSCSNNVEDPQNTDSLEKSVQTSYENEILDIENASFTFNNNGEISSVSLEDIKTMWESQILEEDDMEVNLIDFQLIKSYDEDDDDFYYFLKTKDASGQISTGGFVTLIEGKSYEISAGAKECSCKGCPQGCELYISGSSCRCSNCFPNNPNSKCEKTEKQTIITGR